MNKISDGKRERKTGIKIYVSLTKQKKRDLEILCEKRRRNLYSVNRCKKGLKKHFQRIYCQIEKYLIKFKLERTVFDSKMSLNLSFKLKSSLARIIIREGYITSNEKTSKKVEINSNKGPQQV